MSIAHALPAATRRRLVALLAEAGYTPESTLRLFGSQEPVATRAGRLGAEMIALTRWVLDMDEIAVGDDENAAQEPRLALYVSLGVDHPGRSDPRSREQLLGAARIWWARAPGDVAFTMQQAWRLENRS